MSSADTATDAPDDETVEVEVDDRRQAILDELTARLGDGVVGSHIRPGDDIWVRVDAARWVEAAEAVKAMGFTFFDFLSAIDWLPSPFGRDMDAQEDRIASGDTSTKEPAAIEHGYAGGERRFQVIAHVYDIRRGLGLHLKADLDEASLSVGTWSDTYLGANWHERECAEMFGVTFIGHPNPVKLYLPHDFQGFPLRKDFPLLARRVRPWPGIVDVEPMPGGDDDDEGDGE